VAGGSLRWKRGRADGQTAAGRARGGGWTAHRMHSRCVVVTVRPMRGGGAGDAAAAGDGAVLLWRGRWRRNWNGPERAGNSHRAVAFLLPCIGRAAHRLSHRTASAAPPPRIGHYLACASYAAFYTLQLFGGHQSFLILLCRKRHNVFKFLSPHEFLSLDPFSSISKPLMLPGNIDSTRPPKYFNISEP
jgi:hypothetical protein